MKYIEISSTNRNRQDSPNPSSFNIEINSVNMTAKDPIYNNVNIYPYPSLSSTSSYDTFGYAFNIDPNVYSNEYLHLIPVNTHTSPSENMSHDMGYESLHDGMYVGKYLELVEEFETGNPPSNNINEFHRIIESKVIPYTVNVVKSSNASYVSAVEIGTAGFPPLITNLFVGGTITRVVSGLPNESGNIIYYSPSTSETALVHTDHVFPTLLNNNLMVISINILQVKLESELSVGGKPFGVDPSSGGFGNQDYLTYRIRDAENTRLLLTADKTGAGNNITIEGRTTFSLDNPNVSYVGGMVWINNNYIVYQHNQIGTTNSTANQLYIPTTGFPADYFNGMLLRFTNNIIPYSDFNILYKIMDYEVVAVPGQDRITIYGEFTTSSLDDTVIESSFEIIVPNATNYHQIIGYNNLTMIYTVDNPFTYLAGDGTINVYGTEPVPTNGSVPVVNVDQFLEFNILSFNRDNYTSLDYPESTTAQQQQVCYEFTLCHVSLPRYLDGNLDIFSYPYLYLEFSSTTQGAGIYNIYSTNTVAKKYLFKLNIHEDYVIDTPFVSAGSDCSQIIKFSPNDSYKFSIRTPFGEILNLIDNLSPAAPNILKQISALFSIQRLVPNCVQ